MKSFIHATRNLFSLAALLLVLTPSQAAFAQDKAFTTNPLIDPNTATAEQLAGISGLSDAGVKAVIANRPFETPTQLHEALGSEINDDNQFDIYSAMFVKVNLNSGENEDFRLVPTTLSARKLAHEFEEYRPYDSIDQFRREMSKYVSDEEVDFLTRFVIVD